MKAIDARPARTKLIDGKVGAKARNRFQFVQRAAGVAQRAPGNHGHDHARRCGNGGRDQAGFVADAAG